jgi:NitT/TauT family transport system substrate-binding protein
MKLEYGVPTDKEGLQLRFGMSKGVFRDEGFDASLRVVFGGPEIAAMYDSGELKIGEMGTPPATTAIARGARFKIVGSGIRRRAVQYFVAKQDIADFRDLKGKTVGVLSIGSCSYWFARTVLEHYEIDPDRDLRIVGLGSRYPTVLQQFDSGELQAAVISEPNVTIGEKRSSFHVLKALTDPEFCAAMQWSVIVANEEFAAQQPDMVAAVLRAVRRSHRYATDHAEEFIRFGASYYGIDVSTMKASLEREGPNLHNDCEVDIAGLEMAVALQRRLGAFSKELPVIAITDLRHLPKIA